MRPVVAAIPSFERASQARTHPPFLSASSCVDRIPRISTPLEFVHKATSGVKLDWSAAGRVLVNQERVVSRALTEPPLLRQPALRPVCPRAGDCVVVPNQVRCRISEQTYGPANRLVVDVYHLRVRSAPRVTRRPRAWILQLCELKQGSDSTCPRRLRWILSSTRAPSRSRGVIAAGRKSNFRHERKAGATVDFAGPLSRPGRRIVVRFTLRATTDYGE